MFLCPPILAPSLSFLYVLSRCPITSSFHGVTLYSRHPVGTQWCHLLTHLSWVFQECPLCGLCGPSCCNWVFIAIGLFMHGVNPQAGRLWGLINPNHRVWAGVRVLITQSRICLSRVWCLQRNPFEYATCGANWTLRWCCLKLATGCVHSGPLGKDSGSDMSDAACDWPWATCLELQSDLQFVTDSAGPGCALKKYQAVYQNLSLPVPDLGTGQQKSQVTLKSISVCFLLLGAC